MPLLPVSPPGIPPEALVYGTQGSDVSSSATVVGSGADVLAQPLSFYADGVSSYLVLLLGVGQINSTGLKTNIAQVMLDAVAQGVGMYIAAASANRPLAAIGAFIITPAAGIHTVNWRFYVDGGTGTLFASGSLSPNSKTVVAILRLGG